MSCKRKCGCACNSLPCGCADQAYTTTPQDLGCSTPQTCSEFVYTSCIIYNGPEIPELCLIPGMNLNAVFQRQFLASMGSPCGTCTGDETCTPVVVKFLSVTNTTIDVGWELPADNTNTAGFTAQYSLAGAGSFTSVTQTGPSSTHTVITNLTANTEYDVLVSTNCASSDCDSIIIRIKTKT